MHIKKLVLKLEGIDSNLRCVNPMPPPKCQHRVSRVGEGTIFATCTEAHRISCSGGESLNLTDYEIKFGLERQANKLLLISVTEFAYTLVDQFFSVGC